MRHLAIFTAILLVGVMSQGAAAQTSAGPGVFDIDSLLNEHPMVKGQNFRTDVIAWDSTSSVHLTQVESAVEMHHHVTHDENVWTNPAPIPQRKPHAVWTAVVLAVAYLLAVGPAFVSGRQQAPPFEKLLDYSWVCDMTSQLVEGGLAGRDFIYTYGPLRQVLHGAGIVVGAGDLAMRARLDRCLVAALGVAGVWWLLAKTRAPWAWRTALLLAWFGLDFDLHSKALAGIFIAFGCGGQLLPVDDANVSRRRRAWPFACWSTAAPLATLYCFDLGVFAAATLIATSLAVLLATVGISAAPIRTVRWQAASLGAATITGGLLFAGALLLPFGWEHYLRDSWLVALGYVEQLAYPIALRHFLCLVVAGTAAVATAGLAVGQLRRSWRAGERGEKIAYQQLAIGVLALFLLRYALTRSDPPHVVDAVLPMIFWWGCLVPALWSRPHASRPDTGARWQQHMRWALPALLIAKMLLAPEATAASWRTRFEAMHNVGQQATQLTMDEATARAVRAARALPGSELAIWPNESLIAQAAGKRNPIYALQTFMDMNPPLEQMTIDRLTLGSPPVIALRTAEELDSVSHVARSPGLFTHLLEHYELSGPPQPEFMLLRPASHRGWNRRSVPLIENRPTARLTDGEVLTVPLAGDHQDVRASDVLLLKLSTARPGWSPLAKAARLLIKLTLDTGESRIRYVPLVQDGREQTIGVTYLDPAEPLFVASFSPREVFRSRERVVRIDLLWQPVDFLTPLPERLLLHQLEHLRREGSPVREVSVNDPAEVDNTLRDLK